MMENSKPLQINGRFDNPWSTWKKPSFRNVLKFLLFEKNHSNVPSKEQVNFYHIIVPPPKKSFASYLLLTHININAFLK